MWNLRFERYGPAPWMCGYCDTLIHQFGKDSDDGQVHHIDGDHENDEPSNLAIIHCACHTKLHRIGYKHTQETRDKIANAHKGISKSPEHIAAIKANHVGMLGKTQSPETREKQSAAHRGRPKSAEHRVRLSEAAKNEQRFECPYCDAVMRKPNLVQHVKARHAQDIISQ
jgi:hypothetical protein